MSPGGARRSTGMTSIPGDIGEREFAHHVNRHKRELHVHCYRMLGSFEEAEDLVQETFLRAWRHRDSFEGGPGFRAWLYRIATNACLDAIRRKGRRAEEVSSFAEIPWLQPVRTGCSTRSRRVTPSRTRCWSRARRSSSASSR
jgi:RNA polymerase sigma factor (sigma-70 family)